MDRRSWVSPQTDDANCIDGMWNETAMDDLASFSFKWHNLSHYNYCTILPNASLAS